MESQIQDVPSKKENDSIINNKCVLKITIRRSNIVQNNISSFTIKASKQTEIKQDNKENKGNTNTIYQKEENKSFEDKLKDLKEE